MKKFLISAAAFVLAAPMFAQSQPQRLAVIDVQKVLSTSSAGKVSYEKLKKMQDERIARAQKMDEEIKNLENDLNTKKMSLSEEKVTDITKQISDKKIAEQRYAQDADREVGEARDRELQALEAKIHPVIAMMLIRHLNTTNVYALFAFGQERAISLIALADGAVTMVVSAVLVHRYGIIGAFDRGENRPEEVAAGLSSRLDGFVRRLEALPDRLLLYTDDGDATASHVHELGLQPDSVLVRRSTLEDVFLHLTGRTLVDE